MQNMKTARARLYKFHSSKILYTTIGCLFLALNTLHSSDSKAEPIEILQNNASKAYEQMIQAKQNAENLNKDAALVEKKLSAIKEKLSTTEQEFETAKRKSEQAKLSFQQATEKWKQASDILANEWGNHEIK